MEFSGKNVAIALVCLLVLAGTGILIWYFVFFKSNNSGTGCSQDDPNSCSKNNQWCDISGVCKKCDECSSKCDFQTGKCIGNECEEGDESCGTNKHCSDGNCKDCGCTALQKPQCNLWTGECPDASCELGDTSCGDNKYCKEEGTCAECDCTSDQKPQCDLNDGSCTKK